VGIRQTYNERARQTTFINLSNLGFNLAPDFERGRTESHSTDFLRGTQIAEHLSLKSDHSNIISTEKSLGFRYRYTQTRRKHVLTVRWNSIAPKPAKLGGIIYGLTGFCSIISEQWQKCSVTFTLHPPILHIIGG